MERGHLLLYVQRQAQHVPGQDESFIEPKIKAGRQLLRLGPGTLDVLRRQKERQDLERAVVGR